MTIHAINAEALGISEYHDLTLRGLVEHDGRLYGITPTQLVELTGADDSGTDIDASIKLGKVDLNDPQLKRGTAIYVGGAASGGLTVNVTAEESGTETERSYSMPAWAGSLHERRKKLARGVASRFYQVELANVDGGTFSIEKLGIWLQQMSRRVRGGP